MPYTDHMVDWISEKLCEIIKVFCSRSGNKMRRSAQTINVLVVHYYNDYYYYYYYC